jgi:hypothetical protein
MWTAMTPMADAEAWGEGAAGILQRYVIPGS